MPLESIITLAQRVDVFKRRVTHLDGRLPREQSEFFRIELATQIAAAEDWLDRWTVSAKASGIDVEKSDSR